jgi:uncharacterized LabA/DUF88 family protein
MANAGKTALFIDGPNLHYTARGLGFDIDFKRLRGEFELRGGLLRAYYYTTIVEDGEFNSIQPLLNWLDFNGFTVRTKPAKEFDDGEGHRKIKRNITVDLAVDALELAKYIDRAVIVSGDGDLRSVVAALQRQGVYVTVASTMRTNPAMVADELRRQADAFLDIDDLKTQVGRTARPRSHLAVG